MHTASRPLLDRDERVGRAHALQRTVRLVVAVALAVAQRERASENCSFGSARYGVSDSRAMVQPGGRLMRSPPAWTVVVHRIVTGGGVATRSSSPGTSRSASTATTAASATAAPSAPAGGAARNGAGPLVQGALQERQFAHHSSSGAIERSVASPRLTRCRTTLCEQRSSAAMWS